MKNQPSHWQPTEKQELVLLACYGDTETRRAAAQKWRENVDLENDYSLPTTLLPCVYELLKDENPDDPILQKLNGVARYKWSHRQLYLQNIMPLIKQFDDANVPLLLPGAYAQDGELQFDNRFGRILPVLVPPQYARNAFQLLDRADWRSRKLPDSRIALFNHRLYRSQESQLKLQWRAFETCFDDAREAKIWDRAERIELERLPVYVLSPHDHFLYICADENGWRTKNAYYWIADALRVLSAFQTEKQWTELVADIQSFHLVIPARTLFRYLATQLRAPIPEFALHELDSITASSLEETEFRVLCGEIQPSRWEFVRLNYRRTMRSKQMRELNFVAFIRYLQAWTGAKSLFELARLALARTVARFRSRPLKTVNRQTG